MYVCKACGGDREVLVLDSVSSCSNSERMMLHEGYVCITLKAMCFGREKGKPGKKKKNS